MFINKVFIYGNLTKDPELKTIPTSGMSVTNVSIATNRTWKDQSGTKQDEVEYHDVVFFGKIAEIVCQYLKKGSGIFVEGRIKTRSWEQDGVKKYRTEIIGEQMQFGPKKDGQTGGGSAAQHQQPNASKNISEDDEINPEDIPF